MPSRSRRTLGCAHFLFTPHDSAIVRREQHHSRPRESRSPNALSATLPPNDDRVSVFSFHGRLSNSVRSWRRCESPRLRTGAGGAIGSLLRSERGWYLSGTPVPRATCTLVSVIVHADLTAIRLEPETARRDAPGAELRWRARARRANASRTQVSKSEVNGGLHRRSSWHSQLFGSLRWFTSMDSLGIAARNRARSAGDEPDPFTITWVTSNYPKYEVAPRCSLDRAVSGRGGSSATRGGEVP